MRYFGIDRIREGMKLGGTLYTATGEILLRYGTELTDEYIKRIQELSFKGIFVEDSESREIVIPSIITEDLKLETARVLKGIYTLDEKRFKTLEMASYVSKIKKCVESIVQQVLFDDRQVINLLDVKTYDDVIYFHCINVAILSIAMAETLKYNMKEIEEIALAAILHDIGKRFLPKELVFKTEKYTTEEWKEYQSHSKKGYEFLKDYVNMSSLAYIAVLQHHEKYDGSGYPDGRKQDDINKYAKIISIANDYDKMLSQKDQHPASQPAKAYQFIIRNTNTFYDPEVVRAFATNVALYPVGVTVKLNDGKTAIVAKNYRGNPLRPLVRIVEPKSLKHFLDLKENPDAKNIAITGVDL